MNNHRTRLTTLASVLLLVLAACTDKQQEVDVGPGEVVTAQEMSAVADAVTETAAAAEVSPDPGEGYLTEVIPPCTPVEGASVDPCEPNVPRVGSALASTAPGQNGPYSLLFFLEGNAVRGAHLVVRASYLVESVRCRNYTTDRKPPYMGHSTMEIASGVGLLRCYADVRVNEYIIGSGPPRLTVIVSELALWDERWSAGQVEHAQTTLEQLFVTGGNDIYFVPAGGIEGREEIMFIGPATDYSIETWEVHSTWDVERKADGTVVVVHPFRHYWLAQNADLYRADVEKTLATFKQEAQAAQATRMTTYGGRVEMASDAPLMQTDATKLHQHHVAVGNTTHSDGPPILPTPACGLAITNSRDNPALVQDCEILLASKDTLRGTGTLNWSVDTAIGSWDGVTTGGGGASGASDSATGSHVTKVELANKGLTGSVPEELEELDLEVLKLSGNSLTGCIPVGLKDVPTNDLSSLNLLYCKPPAPAPIAWAVGETTFQLTWPAIANAGTYRLEHRLATADAWTTASDAITATEYSVSGLPCGTAHEFRLSAKGSGTVYAAAWSDPWEVAETTTPCVTPVFDETSYAFTVSEDAAVGAGIGVVSATDPNGDAVSYSITSGNEDGTFVVSGVTSERSENTLIVAKSLDFDTTPSYTLTVEARDRSGNASSVTVTVTEANNAPVFGQSSYAFSVAENAGQYSVVGTVAATDADGDSVTYHITAGNSDGKFSIDANAGFIVVRGSLDYETTPSYTLTVEARDGKGRAASATVAITVTDVAE